MLNNATIGMEFTAAVCSLAFVEQYWAAGVHVSGTCTTLTPPRTNGQRVRFCGRFGSRQTFLQHFAFREQALSLMQVMYRLAKRFERADV